MPDNQTSTTWMQEIVPLIVSGGDPASVETLPNWDRVPWLEHYRNSSRNLQEKPSPRMFTTHVQYNMMPPSFFEVKPRDLKDSVARIAQFLQKSLDAEVIEKIADRCLFKNMKKNNMSNYKSVPREQMDQTKFDFLRKGTTWMQEIVPLIVSGGDPASVETLPNWDRVPWLEHYRNSSRNLQEKPSPRMFTTHVQYNMMPPSFFEVKPRVINVMRNPKDAFASLFYYSEMASHWVNPGSQNEFLHKFLDGKVVYGSWFDHVKSWLNAEDKEHIMYISYEEMIMDLKDSVARIAQFLQKSLDTEVIEKIADRCFFKNMKKNNMSNYKTVPREQMDQTKFDFLRKGIVGDWKNQLTVAEAEYFDAVYKDKMKDVQYKFAWE
ncbi:hypothetical protein ABVT39_016315 [Epinephelus coioides]